MRCYLHCLYYHCLSAFLLLVFGAAGAQAQGQASAGSLPVPYGPSNMGRDFWVAFPVNQNGSSTTEPFIRFYITSAVRTEVKIWAGPGIKTVLHTIPNGVVKADLTPLEGQMFIRGTDLAVPFDKVYKQKAVRIQAGAPIVVYAMNSNYYTAEGMLLLPTGSLGREYIVGAYTANTNENWDLPSQYMIIAPHNKTTVTIYHPGRTPNHAAKETFKVVLDSGDVWSAMTVGANGDMSGAIIRSDKPVAVTAGAGCSYVPQSGNNCCCNHLAEMLLPTETWGKVYHAVPIKTYTRSLSYYRIFAREPGTKVQVNGEEYVTLTQAGGEEGAGWIEYRPTDTSLVEFKASKPIQVIQYYSSRMANGMGSNPFAMVLTPMEQYQQEMLFCTPVEEEVTGGILNVVCDMGNMSEMEITEADRENWRPILSLEWADTPRDFTTEIDGKMYQGTTVAVEPGAYKLRSRGQFGATLYSYYVNGVIYGYPLGFRTINLGSSDRDAPGLSKNLSCDGTVLGVVTDMPDDDGTRTNIFSIELDPEASFNYELTRSPFEEGISRTAAYRLEVIDKSRSAMAVVIITDMAGNVMLDTIRHDYVNFAVSSTPQNYGALRLGQKKTMTVTLTNESDFPSTSLEVMLKSNQEGFRILFPAQGAITLGPKGTTNSSVNVVIEFTADMHRAGSMQSYSDSLGVRDTCGTRYLALVEARVVKPMIEVTDLSFETSGSEEVIKEMIVRNPSPLEGSMLTVTYMVGPNHNLPGVEIFDVRTGSALQFPFALAPNESRNLMVAAKGPRPGRYYDTLFFVSDAMEVEESDDYGSLDLLVQGPSSVDQEVIPWALGAVDVLPNPAGGDEVVLEYSITRRGPIAIELLDVNGQLVRVIEEEMEAETGLHRMTVDIKGLSAGTYFARIRSGIEARMKRFVVVQ